MRHSLRSFAVFGLLPFVGATALVELLPERSAYAGNVPIVYSRCPRSGKPFTVTGPLEKNGVTTMASVQVTGADLLESIPDTARPMGNFIAPCDLVYNDGAGNEKILYSCIAGATPAASCAALDASVSFDAKSVAFSVFRGPMTPIEATANGTVFDPAATNGTFYVDLPGFFLQPTEAQIVVVDIASGAQTPLPFPPNTINFGPTWMSDGRIAFTSAGRRNIYGPIPMCSDASALSMQLYAMDATGLNVELISSRATASELHPFQLQDGRLAVSSWQIFGMLPYRHANGYASCGTVPNFFQMYTESPDGANERALLGQHLSDPTSLEYPNLEPEMAHHFFGQTTSGMVWTTEYYRGNNFGLGTIQGFPLLPAGEEGPNVVEAAEAGVSAYRPPGEVRLALWASDNDSYANPMPSPSMTIPGYKDPLYYAGKIGHPSGLPNNAMLLTWGVGPCSQNSGLADINAMQALTAQAGDNPACDLGIYATPPLPANASEFVSHPSQLIPIVNSPDYHEFFARPVVAYSAVHNTPAPAAIPRAELTADPSLEAGTPLGVIGASSLLFRETHPLGPINFVPPPYTMVQGAILGTDLIEYQDADLCGIRILSVLSNRHRESNGDSASTINSTTTLGERVAILGEFPVRNYDASGNPIMDPLGMPDTSFRVAFPAEAPYLMQGIDCQGRALTTDQTWQSLRPGEVKTCNGCHVHSAAAMTLPFASSLAGTGKTKTQILGTGTIPLLTGGSGASVTQTQVPGYTYMVEFDHDVAPILQSRCVSCHGGASPAAGLSLDIPRTNAMAHSVATGVTDDSTYYRLALDETQSFVPASLRFNDPLGGNTIGKPNLTKYVRMMNARGSLLYWKAANQRTDGLTDASRATDVDFGAAHPTSITPTELAVLSRWIDTGAGWGPDFETDTTWPTLHVVGVGTGQSLSSLKVGTVDVGLGVDTGSLTVCVLPSGSTTCGPNLAGKAAAAGVVTIPLSSPLTNPNDQVVATVKDLAGNETDQQWTVGFLLNAPPPSVGADAGVADAGPGATHDGGLEGDAGAEPGDAGPGSSEGTAKGGCSCRMGQRAPEQFAALLTLGLGLAAIGRRRRR